MTDELLFYIGIAIAVCSIFFAIVFFVVSKIKKKRLDVQLDREYGKE